MEEKPQNRIKIIEEKEDRLSALPDCLLSEILSRLPLTRFVIQTSILSKRWIHVWTSVSNLIIKFPPGIAYLVPFLDKTLTQRGQSKLNKFQLRVRYKFEFLSHLNNCICHAINCNVEDLDLRCLNSPWVGNFRFHKSFLSNSRVTHLTSPGFLLNPSEPISWKKLTSLHIIKGKVDKALLNNILSGSPLLETLVLDSCYGYRQLDITSKNVKNLVIHGYMDPEGGDFELVYAFEISAPDISSLTIKGDLELQKLLLLDVSSLVKVDLDYTVWYHGATFEDEEETLKGFILSLHHVMELKIGESCVMALSRLEAAGFIRPSNLKVTDGSDTPRESFEESLYRW